MKRLALAAMALVAALVWVGLAIDEMRPLRQLPLWSGIQLASAGGVVLGVAAFRRAAPRAGSWLLIALGGILAWRLAYFPIMVFSGHVASVGEWLLLVLGFPVVVFPTFLLAVAGLHVAAGAAVGCLLWPLKRMLRFAAAGAFLVAAAVSFNQLEDLSWLPDRVTRLDGPIPQIPPTSSAGGSAENPYLSAFIGPGYLPNQRVVLLAAGLTYETIPPSPWAESVKAVLGDSFRSDPFASTTGRVREHYAAYHASHAQIGCRARAACSPAAL